jgi:GMP synthase (glutamine-hydrolysing)
VYDKQGPHVGKDVWDLIEKKKLPVLGICYGLQEMCHSLGGQVEPGTKREFGHAELHARTDVTNAGATTGKRSKGISVIFEGLDVENAMKVWMSHGDKVTKLPDGFASIGYTSNTEYAAVENQAKRMYGVQFHPEVTHTPCGAQIIKNFCLKVCGCKGDWNMQDFCKAQVDIIMNKLQGKYVVGAVSGGVDSSVAAALVHRAVGDKFRPFMVDTGLLRKDEAVVVKERLEKHIDGLNLKVLDARQEFYKELAGVTEPEKKRKIIGRLFIEAFERAVKEMGLKPEQCLLLQGTLYPDVIESTSFKGPSSVIKTHHNVGGLPDRMKMEVIEPLRLLFKDEVRALGRELGLPHESVMRHPFPGPGLGIRILGEVTEANADVLRLADDIYIEELRKAGYYDKIGQAFAVLLATVKSVGVMGDHRTYENVCVLRAVQTSDFMTADWYPMPYDLIAKISNRICNEVRGINRVVYDVSSKPPATIEWE